MLEKRVVYLDQDFFLLLEVHLEVFDPCPTKLLDGLNITGV